MYEMKFLVAGFKGHEGESFFTDDMILCIRKY